MTTDPGQHLGGSDDRCNLRCIYTASFSKELKVSCGWGETDRQIRTLWRSSLSCEDKHVPDIHPDNRLLREAWLVSPGEGRPDMVGR